MHKRLQPTHLLESVCDALQLEARGRLLVVRHVPFPLQCAKHAELESQHVLHQQVPQRHPHLHALLASLRNDCETTVSAKINSAMVFSVLAQNISLFRPREGVPLEGSS